MKFSRFLLSLLLIVAAMSPIFAADYQKAQSKVYRLRLRATPSTAAPVVGYLAKSESVSIIDKSTFTATVSEKKNYWFQVLNSSGTKGWVFGAYLNIPTEPK